MASVCNQCGLPSDLCVCDTLAREQQKITSFIEKKKFGKKYTIIDGLGKGVNMDEVLKKLKSKFACGGTVKQGRLELQGDYLLRVKGALVELGFPEEAISVGK